MDNNSSKNLDAEQRVNNLNSHSQYKRPVKPVKPESLHLDKSRKSNKLVDKRQAIKPIKKLEDSSQVVENSDIGGLGTDTAVFPSKKLDNVLDLLNKKNDIRESRNTEGSSNGNIVSDSTMRTNFSGTNNDVGTDDELTKEKISSDTRRVNVDQIENSESFASPTENDSWRNARSTAVRVSYQDKLNSSGARKSNKHKVIGKEAKLTILEPAKKRIPWYNSIVRRGPSKEYRLKGYANKQYARQVRIRKKRIMTLSNILFWIIIIVCLLLVYYYIDPIDDYNKFKHMLGMD